MLKAQNLLGLLIFLSFIPVSAQAQSIIPASDGTGTVVNPQGNQLNITGGTLSGDQANLFQSFSQFGLNNNEIANFISNPNIRNILGRVTGGNASVINGLIQVTGGNSNLYLLNPAGMVFGNNAQLNVPASFSATTATGIGFGANNWFNATGTNNYAALTGNPGSFAFNLSQPGSIINAGNLSVKTGQNLSLIGGNVINIGTLTAPQGNITIAAVPGSSNVLLSQPGNVLSLEINPSNTSNSGINPGSLAQLITGSSGTHATGVAVNSTGEVVLTGSGTVIPEGGTAVASGTINVSPPLGKGEFGGVGGQVNVLGDKVGVIGGNINASGNNGGGTVLIGGDYLGKGTVPNASRTFVSSDSTINADAINTGNGGRVIAWADQSNRFLGNISARGGSQSGNGGFVEVSGKENLDFRGNVNTTAVNGNAGMLLLDPTNITVINGPGSFTSLAQVSDFNAPDVGDNTIDAALLNNAATNVTLQATNDITFSAPVNMTNAGVGLTALANRNINVNANITTNNGNLTLTADADNLNGGALTVTGARIFTGTGAISLTGKGLDGAPGSIGGDGITLNDSQLISSSGNITLIGTGGAGGRGTDGTTGVTSTRGTNALNDAGNGGQGIVINNSSITSTSGLIALTGTGGAGGVGGNGGGGGNGGSGGTSGTVGGSGGNGITEMA